MDSSSCPRITHLSLLGHVLGPVGHIEWYLQKVVRNPQNRSFQVGSRSRVYISGSGRRGDGDSVAVSIVLHVSGVVLMTYAVISFLRSLAR